ncbi:MAG: C1 family peptidase [Bacilli bacterium]|jgi:bleomycin hydrolase|nr:C1 family peptidase [Bacilli bacterium]
MKESVELKDLDVFEKTFDKDPKNAVSQQAASRVGIKEASINLALSGKLTYAYSLEVEPGKVTNQRQSGRCWMFAATNVLRFEVMKNLNLENMELSQTYPFFFDKLEKSNYFLESILKTLDEPLSGRLVAFLLTDPLGDGGQWDMFVNLVNKYGVCPKSAMPETFSSTKSLDMDKALTKKLREFASVLRTLHEKGMDAAYLRGKKDEMLAVIYRMLVISLGKPPKTFTFEARDKEKKFVRISNITPKEFYQKYVKLNLADYVSVINAPTGDKPYLKSFTVKFLGNVVGGNIVRYLNLPVKELKRLAIAQLKDKDAVWFGSDVGQSSTRDSGYLDLDAYKMEDLFSTHFALTKAERLDYGESKMTHAMTLVGVNLNEKDEPLTWKVENSWGEDTGDKGMYAMGDDWFSEYVYQVVVNKKYLTKEELAAYQDSPIELEPWDPCGSLAL